MLADLIDPLAMVFLAIAVLWLVVAVVVGRDDHRKPAHCAGSAESFAVMLCGIVAHGRGEAQALTSQVTGHTQRRG